MNKPAPRVWERIMLQEVVPKEGISHTCKKSKQLQKITRKQKIFPFHIQAEYMTLAFSVNYRIQAEQQASS